MHPIIIGVLKQSKKKGKHHQKEEEERLELYEVSIHHLHVYVLRENTKDHL